MMRVINIMWLVNKITLSCIYFMFIEIKFTHCHYCLMFVMKFMSIFNDCIDYDEIII